MDYQHFSYGGQAVIEGVMMRGRQQATVAVYQPDGGIAYHHIPLARPRHRSWHDWPLLRGVVMLWEALHLGVQALHFSASASQGKEEPAAKRVAIGTLLLSLAVAIGLFFLLPLLFASIFSYLGASMLQREILEAIVRLGIIIAYVLAISRMPEMKRVFGYHGAEHKTVNAYEAGADLTVETVRRFSLFHPRCGTSFLVLIVLVSFVVFLFLGGMPFWLRGLSRIVGIPLIAALAYELLRLSARHSHRPWVRIITVPSLFFQQLTTREPDDQMIAIAIAALVPVLAADGVPICKTLATDEQILATSV